MPSDAFTHLPLLRESLVPADRSELRVTPEVLAVWDERARALGRPRDWRLSNEELEARRRGLLAQHDAAQDLWVYAYGSLMWDPGIHFSEVRRGQLDGYRRRFSYRITMGRGSPDRPGLMLTLEPGGGTCEGLVFRIAADRVHAESAFVWRREMVRGGYRPAFLPVVTPQGTVTALVFCANESHPEHVGERPLAETASIIASGTGILGTNRQYLEQLAVQLGKLGVEDAYVERLARLVRGIPAI